MLDLPADQVTAVSVHHFASGLGLTLQTLAAGLLVAGTAWLALAAEVRHRADDRRLPVPGAAVRDVRPPARHRSLRLGREGLWGGMDLGPGALTSAGMLMSPPAHTRPVADGDLPVAGARFDAFVSYRRIAEDTAFVDRLQAALAGRGKKVWVDRAEIEPASDWSERIARGIEATKAFVYVITPESVASQEFRREYSMAVRRNKLVIPVVLRDLGQHPDLPEDLARLNWIFFSRGHDFEQALDEVIVALEEDLDWRDAHTRLGVRAGE